MCPLHWKTELNLPSFSSPTIQVTLDLSEDGPVFSALDEMMMKLIDEDSAGRAKNGQQAKNALKNLLRSGIPGIENMFAQPDVSLLYFLDCLLLGCFCPSLL